MMILVPDWIPAGMVEQAPAVARDKRQLPALPAMLCESFDEDLSVQIMQIGPYDDEGPVLERMHHQFFPAWKLSFNGRHHEINLSDPRRVASGKLKTILRQPVRVG